MQLWRHGRRCRGLSTPNNDQPTLFIGGTTHQTDLSLLSAVFDTMSYYYSSYDHPFSYAARRPWTLSRVGTRLWETLGLRTDRGRHQTTDLHDMALTAQPPLLRRATHHRKQQASHFWDVTEDVVVTVALAVAAGLLTRAVVAGVWAFWNAADTAAAASKSRKDDTKETLEAKGE